MEAKEPNYISSNQWIRHKKLVAEATFQMEKYLKVQGPNEEEKLRTLRRKLKELQNKFENQRWGPVRIIESSETLIVEKALECMLSPHQSGFWSYHVAREYEERYNPAYGTGLLPESAPMVEDIANFWSQRLSIDNMKMHSKDFST